MPAYDRYVVRHLRSGQTLSRPAVAPGETLYETLERHGLPIRTTCRGSTICGLCVVRVEEGLEDLVPPSDAERILLDRHGNTEPNARLACQLTFPDSRDEVVVSLLPPGE